MRNWNYLVFAQSPQTESLFLCGDGNTFLNSDHIEFGSKDVKFKRLYSYKLYGKFVEH
jgi:hypothetical protein